MADADDAFGGRPVSLRRLTDRAGILRRGDRERLEAAMERISQRLPQVFVAIYTGALGDATKLRPFGFWLLNRAVFTDLAVEQTNEAGILLIIDPEIKAAGVVFGYRLDPFLEESDTFECLTRGHAYWLEQRYADGLIRVLAHLEGLLCKRSRQAHRHPERFERKILPLALTGQALLDVRAGQRHAAIDQPAQEVLP